MSDVGRCHLGPGDVHWSTGHEHQDQRPTSSGGPHLLQELQLLPWQTEHIPVVTLPAVDKHQRWEPSTLPPSFTLPPLITYNLSLSLCVFSLVLFYSCLLNSPKSMCMSIYIQSILRPSYVYTEFAITGMTTAQHKN